MPTPIDAARRPDLARAAAAHRETVGSALKRGDIVVYESTVYPGATEEVCVPVLEQASGLRAGATSPSATRPSASIPATRQHRFETITKVVSGQDARDARHRRGRLRLGGQGRLHRAPSIKVAEAAKVIENTQRDLNIAFMNELSAIFHALGIDTGDVLAAAGTKWNFLPFTPGLVGGHCIGVDPYYLTHAPRRPAIIPR